MNTLYNRHRFEGGTSQGSRRRYSQLASLVMLVLTLGALVPLRASATDFTLTATSHRFYSSGTFDLRVDKNIPGPLRLTVQINYSTNTITFPADINIDDSSTYGYIEFTYKSYLGRADSAEVTITDSVTSATFFVYGQDTSYHGGSTITADFSVGLKSPLYINFTDTTGFGVTNVVDDQISVLVTLSGDTAWSLIGDPRTNLVGDSMRIPLLSTKRLVVGHTFDGKRRDTAYLFFSCFSPIVQGDTIEVIYVDTLSSFPTLTSTGATYSNTDVGDTSCQSVTLTNTGANAVQVTSLSVSGEFYLSSTPTLPLTISAGASQAVTVCFTPHEAYSTDDGAVIVRYNSSGDTVTSNFGLEGHSPRCLLLRSLSANDSILWFDNVIVGGWVDGKVVIVNQTDTTWEVTETLSPSNIFSFDPNPFPITLAPHASDTITLRFSPTTVGQQGGKFYAQTLSQDCGETDAELMGVAIADTSTAYLDLEPQETELLPMTGADTGTTDTFYFRNNSGSRLKVDTAYFKNGTHFSIVSPTSFEVELNNGQTLAMAIRADGDSSGFYQDSLMVITENGITAIAYKVQALLKQATAGVSTLVSSPTQLLVSPNPSHGPVSVSVSGARKANIEIVDLLGRTIASSGGLMNWMWQSAQSSGVYFVRASGIDVAGHTFTTTTRVVMER